MKSLLLLLLTFSTIGLSAQTNPQNKFDKNQVFNDNISNLSASLKQNDTKVYSTFFEPATLTNFNSIFKSKEDKKRAAEWLKSPIVNQTPNTKMITGDGYQIHFLFKKDKWVIQVWDIFSAD
jgi:hypothetical protein